MSAYVTWLLDGKLAASSYPFEEADLIALAERGIGLVVNLHEPPHPPATLARLGLREMHLPIVDFQPPTLEQIERGVEAIQAALASGDGVVVHCHAGLGRTGTLLACVLVRRGLPPDDAIARVRAARPGSVETAGQVARVAEYAAHLERSAPDDQPSDG